jgi:hypothetical protein
MTSIVVLNTQIVATNPAETTQPEWKSRNNAHLIPILPTND